MAWRSSIRLARVAVMGAIATTLFAGPTGRAASTTDVLPPAGTVTRAYTRPGANRPSVLVGVLSQARDGTPILIARSYLATNPPVIRGVIPTSLRLERVRWHKQGAAVKFQQTFEGIDVIGGTVGVRIDGEGRVRWVSSGVTPIPASFDVVPYLTPVEAVVAVVGRDSAGSARVVILGDPVFDEPRLVYEVSIPRDRLTLQSIRGYVDAKTGRVLARDDLVMTAESHQANVHAHNPVVTPDTSVVTFWDLADGATRLAGPDVTALSCVDLRSCVAFDADWYHVCEPTAKATTDAAGTFLEIEAPAVDTNPIDPFAEVQLYHHVGRAIEAFRTISDDRDLALGSSPITVLANFRVPQSVSGARCTGSAAPATSQLGPYDGAAFMPAQGAQGGDWLVFGQGTSVDMAYDGDLVYHEVAHAVIASVTRLGLHAPDPHGLDPTPAALHEGYADYFTAAISEDAEIAEYAGMGLGSPRPSGALRSAENGRTCARDLAGEPHRDGEAWLAALWAVRRERAGLDRAAMDSAVFAAMDLLGELDTAAIAQTMTLGELELVLGAGVADEAAAAFHARGLDGCEDRVVAIALDEAREVHYVRGTTTPGEPSPGPLQLALELEQTATELRIDFAQAKLVPVPGLPALPDLRLLVKADEPIEWDWSTGGAIHDADLEGRVVVNPISGPGSGTIQADLPPGLYHLQLANASAATIGLYDVRFSVEYASGGDGDAGPGGVRPPGGRPGTGIDNPAGCGCSAGGRSPAGGFVLAAAALLLFAVRRARGRDRIR